MEGNELVKACIKIMEKYDQCSDEYEVAIFALAAMLGEVSVCAETLSQLVEKGPIWDGDLISKGARDTLLELGLAVKCCYKGGKTGYQVATYSGYEVYTLFRKKRGE